MANALLCTVGTSLIFNLKKLKEKERSSTEQGILAAFESGDWDMVAEFLQQSDPSDKLLGAEINSNAALFRKEKCIDKDCRIFLFTSPSPDGNAAGEIINAYYLLAGYNNVEIVPVADLVDTDHGRFGSLGLRNLAKEMAAKIRECDASNCAINATGGYKAQIAIAVLLGQALHIPVFYKYENFPSVISFPPMPVSLDPDLWMEASGVLYDLANTTDMVRLADYADEWNSRYECLVERIPIDEVQYICISPVGQIFHDTFDQKFASVVGEYLPPPAEKKLPNQTKTDEDWEHRYPKAVKLAEKIATAIPQVERFRGHYSNKDLPRRTHARLTKGEIELEHSDGSWCVKWFVDTSAKTKSQKHAVIASINNWLTKEKVGG